MINLSIFKSRSVLLLIPFITFSSFTLSEVLESDNDFIELSEVEVWSDPYAQKMGTQKVSSEDIEKMPTGNGNITDLLKNNPNVQFSSSDSTSQAQGEIAPENISFHGERFYNNAWLIDGMSNNDNINPGSNNGSLSAIDGQVPFNLPDGGTQSFWVNSDIVDSVDVYDSNISAKYGQFTGGVIDANLKSPDTLSAWGNVSYRVTKDEWTNFHFESEEQRSEFEEANRLYNQPKFTKQFYSINANQPFSDSLALLFSYNRVTSTIPFHHQYSDTWEDQTRLTETYLLKGLYEADNGDLWNTSLIYSPHESNYIFPDTKDGGFAVNGGGYAFTLDWEHFFDYGTVNTSVGYKSTINSVEFEEDNFYAWELTSSIDWQSTDTNAQEGGFGNVSTGKDTFTTKQDYDLDPVSFNAWRHKPSFGWKADFAEARYERNQETNIYTSTGSLVPAICFDNDDTCIAGEQAADIRISYQAGNVNVSNNHYAFYLQDQIKWKELEITAGLRTDYDEFLSSFDVAPRLTASYDLRKPFSTVLFAGINRYYSDSLLAYALSQEKGNSIRYLRDDYDAGWIYDADRTIGGNFLSSDLDTPYSDEVNLGFTQTISNVEWTFKWVNRKGRDHFVRNTSTDDSGAKSYWLTNDGRSESDNFSIDGKILTPLSWKGLITSISFGGNYTETKSTFTSYDPGHLFSDSSVGYLSGEAVSVDEIMSRNQYSQPWRFFTTLNTALFNWGINWIQDYSYTTGYRMFEATGDSYTCVATDDSCNGALGSVSIYDEIRYKDRFLADWRFTYDIPFKETNLMITLDILNVFDSKIEGEGLEGTTSNISYQPGRRFWLGANYSW